MSEELKPCPFCGGEAHFIKVKHVVGVWYTVCCDDAECFGHEQSRLYTLRRLAAEAWNRRAERTCGELRGEPRHDAIGYSAAHEDDELWCEHCDIELDDSWLFCPNCGARVVEEEK